MLMRENRDTIDLNYLRNFGIERLALENEFAEIWPSVS